MAKRARSKTKRTLAKADPVRRKGADGIDERYLVPALIRGLDILQMLSGDHRKRSLSEIAADLGVTRSSAYRLLYTLNHLGFVESEPATKNYMLGPQVLRLGYGYLASRDLVEVAMPHLVRLRDRTSWSAHLGELHGRDVLYLARVPTRRSIASTVHVGTRLPAHATAMGRILLSKLAESEIHELYRDEQGASLNARKAVNVSALIRQLAEDRASGVVVQNAVYEPGVASVAAPVYDVTGKMIAAINISIVALFTTETELNGSLKAEVVAAAQAISHDLGRHAHAHPSTAVPRDNGSSKQETPQRRQA